MELSATKEIARPLWYPKFHYSVHKGPSLVPFLNKMNTFHALPPYFPKIQSNIIFPSTQCSNIRI